MNHEPLIPTLHIDINNSNCETTVLDKTFVDFFIPAQFLFTKRETELDYLGLYPE